MLTFINILYLVPKLGEKGVHRRMSSQAHHYCWCLGGRVVRREDDEL